MYFSTMRLASSLRISGARRCSQRNLSSTVSLSPTTATKIRPSRRSGATLTSVMVIATASAAWRRCRMSLTSRWTSSLILTMRLDTYVGRVAGPSEGRPDLLGVVALDDVAHLVAVEIVQLDAALEAGAHLVCVVLEALERRNLALVHDLAGPAQAGRGSAVDLALGDEAAGHKALGERERRAHLGGTELDLLDVGIEQVRHHLAHLVPELVDDLEGLDAHAVVLGERGDAVLQLGAETQDDSARRRRHDHVVLRHEADLGRDDLERDLGALDSLEYLPDGLRGAEHVGL